MDWLEYGVLFAVAAVVTIALTPLARKLAIKLDAIDYPSARRVNMLPIPRMGGVAIFGGILAALAVAGFGVYAFGWVDPFIDYNGIEVNYWGVLLGTVLIFLVGAVDDVVDLNPKAKMLGQIVAACVVAGSGLLFSSIHNPFGEGYIEFGWVAYPLTVFYLVAFANVINLIDGLDGLAAGITGISAITILLFAVLTGRFDAALFSVILVGVCAGFLKSNFFPASIFMGDSGALLLGFSLGVISLFAVARSGLVRFAVGAYSGGWCSNPRYVFRHCASKARASSYRRSRQGAHPPSPDACRIQSARNRAYHVGLDGAPCCLWRNHYLGRQSGAHPHFPYCLRGYGIRYR